MRRDCGATEGGRRGYPFLSSNPPEAASDAVSLVWRESQ
jgi:hypothetical protein